jgi:hypothetical protein
VRPGVASRGKPPGRLSCMDYRRRSECDNLAPVWRRSLLESEMRTPTSRLEVAIVVAFLIAAAALLVYFLPGFLGLH